MTKIDFSKMPPRQKPTRETQIKNGVTSIVFAVIVVILFVWFNSGDDKKVDEKQRYDKIQAFVECHQFVSDRLKSPGSAEWALYEEGSVIQHNDSTFTITSFVDSQNGFGALLRTNYTCKITFLPGNKTGLNSIQLY